MGQGKGDKRRQDEGKDVDSSLEQVGSGREIKGEFSQEMLKARAAAGGGDKSNSVESSQSAGIYFLTYFWRNFYQPQFWHHPSEFPRAQSDVLK